MFLDKDYLLIFSERLRYLRENNNLTQQQLSDNLKKQNINISKDMISSYERCTREVKITQIIAFCKYFNTSFDFLLGFTQIPYVTDSQKTGDIDFEIKKFLESKKIDEKTFIELLDFIQSILRGVLFDGKSKNSNL